MFFALPKFDTTFNEDGTVTLTAPCKITNKPHSVTVPEVGYRQWITGNALIQSAFPDSSLDDREFLITGFSPEGWQLAVGDEEDIVEEDSDEVLRNDDVFEDEDDFKMHRDIMRGR